MVLMGGVQAAILRGAGRGRKARASTMVATVGQQQALLMVVEVGVVLLLQAMEVVLQMRMMMTGWALCCQSGPANINRTATQQERARNRDLGVRSKGVVSRGGQRRMSKRSNCSSSSRRRASPSA